MSLNIVSDVSLEVVKRALDGLSMRRDLIGQNLSNVDTPGYKAQENNFENVLQLALKRGSTLSMSSTNSRHLAMLKSEASPLTQVSLRAGGSERADGNNVDIDQELAQMTETGVRYQALTQVVSKKYQLVRSIAESR